MDLDTTNVIAIQMNLPAYMSWAANVREEHASGKTPGELVHFITKNKLETATLSLSLLLPVELGQGATIKHKE